MELSSVEKAIYKEIEKNRKIRWRDLKSIIVDKKHLVSERVFRETLNEMVKNKLVHRREISRQNVEYYIDVDVVDLEKNAKEFFGKNLPELKRLVKHIEINRSKIPIVDLAGYIALLWQVTNHFGFKAAILAYLTNTNRFVQSEELGQIFHELYKLIIHAKNQDDIFKLMEISDAILNQTTYEMLRAIRNDLESKKIPWSPSSEYQNFLKSS